MTALEKCDGGERVVPGPSCLLTTQAVPQRPSVLGDHFLAAALALDPAPGPIVETIRTQTLQMPSRVSCLERLLSAGS